MDRQTQLEARVREWIDAGGIDAATGSLARQRGFIRTQLKETLAEIDRLVRKIL